MQTDDLSRAYSCLFSEYDYKEMDADFRSGVVSRFYEGETKEWIERGPVGQMEVSELKKAHFSGLLHRLVAHNPQLSKTARCCRITPVNTQRRLTRIVREDESEPSVLLIDAGVTTFLWLMNIALIYGESSGRFSGTSIASSTLLAYGLHVCLGADSPSSAHTMAPWPETPPHKSEQAITLLATLTSFQEMFVIGHEIAHIELGHLAGMKSSYEMGLVSEFLKGKFRFSEGVKDEIAADRLSFQLCLATVPPDAAEAVAKSLCIMLRYFLWSGVLVHKWLDEDVDWAYRYYEFPRYASEFCATAPLVFEDTRGELEARLEKGAHKAIEAFGMISEALKSR